VKKLDEKLKIQKFWLEINALTDIFSKYSILR